MQQSSGQGVTTNMKQIEKATPCFLCSRRLAVLLFEKYEYCLKHGKRQISNRIETNITLVRKYE